MSTTTRTHSQTTSQTTVITGGDVRKVVGLVNREIGAVCQAAAHMTRDFDVDTAETDLGLLVLNEVITSVQLQIYHGDEVVAEYRFAIADQPLEAWGPPAEQPPLPPIPEGARVRLVVESNSRIPQTVRDTWYRKLGWGTATPLRQPEGAISRPYGTFVSGGFAVERRLLTNPKYDRAYAGSGRPAMRKEERS